MRQQRARQKICPHDDYGIWSEERDGVVKRRREAYQVLDSVRLYEENFCQMKTPTFTIDADSMQHVCSFGWASLVLALVDLS